MDEDKVRKYVGKKVLVILKNNFQYTITIPRFEGSSFNVKDKFGKEVDIECDFISFISEVNQ
jgi:small nuclear ribonucleoprotein (snRNP)-like protein